MPKRPHVHWYPVVFPGDAENNEVGYVFLSRRVYRQRVREKWLLYICTLQMSALTGVTIRIKSMQC